eukprot:104258_1
MRFSDTKHKMDTKHKIIIMAVINVCFILIMTVERYTTIEIQYEAANSTYNTSNNHTVASHAMNSIMSYYKWTEIPPNDMESHFTKYELESIKYYPNQQEVICHPPQSTPDYCCISSTSHGGYSAWNNRGTCEMRNYKRKVNYYFNNKAFNTNNLFWKISNNSNLIIIGDSVMNQLFGAFECDIARNNYYPFNHTHNRIYKTKTIYKTNNNLNLTYMASNWSGITYAMYHINHDYHYHIKHISNVSYFGYTSNNKKHIINVMFIRNHRPFLSFYKERFCEWANMILFGWSLHYEPHLNDKRWAHEIGNGILKILETCFTKYNSLQKQPIFIWLEGTAQHFANMGGDWHFMYKNKNNRMSDIYYNEYRKLIANKTGNYSLLTDNKLWYYWLDSQQRHNRGAECIEHNFLNKEFENNIRRIRFQNKTNNMSFNVEFVYLDKLIDGFKHNTLYYIPIRDVTNELWDLHGNGDCTHWCMTPYLHQFTWDSMYRIVNKNVG